MRKLNFCKFFQILMFMWMAFSYYHYYDYDDVLNYFNVLYYAIIKLIVLNNTLLTFIVLNNRFTESYLACRVDSF